MDRNTLYALELNTVLENKTKSLKESRFHCFLYMIGFGAITAPLGYIFYHIGTAYNGTSKHLLYCLAGILFFDTLICVFLFIQICLSFRKGLGKINFIRRMEHDFRDNYALIAFRHYQMSSILCCIMNQLTQFTVEIDDLETPNLSRPDGETFITTSTVWHTIVSEHLAAENVAIHDYKNRRTIGIHVTEDFDIRIVIFFFGSDKIAEFTIPYHGENDNSCSLYDFLKKPESEHILYDFDFHSPSEHPIYSYLRHDFHSIPS